MVQCSDKSLYTGWTTDPERRILAHNAGRGAKYTKTRLPVHLVYLIQCEDRSTALKKEAAIKKLSRKAKSALVFEEENLIKNVNMI